MSSASCGWPRPGLRGAAAFLELGAGNGSVAHWLADKAGWQGRVVAADIKPQHIKPHELLAVIEHNIAADPLPPGPFDLIHARLLLAHLPQRYDILAKLVEALAPGSAVVIEEWGEVGGGDVMMSPDPIAEELYGQYQDALLDFFRCQNNDTMWSVRVYPSGAMEAEGVTGFDRGRDRPHGRPPAQIPACGTTALGSCLGCLASKRDSG